MAKPPRLRFNKLMESPLLTSPPGGADPALPSVIEAESSVRLRYENALFLHWAYDSATVQRSLPRGLRPRLFGGKAWVGMVAAFVCAADTAFPDGRAWPTHFLELALRTYAEDERGQPGILLYSVCSNQRRVVEDNRAVFGLRYEHAAMTGFQDNDGFSTLISQRPAVTELDRFVYRRLDAPCSQKEEGLVSFFFDHRAYFGVQGLTHAALPFLHRRIDVRQVELTTWSAAEFGHSRLPAPHRAPDHQAAACIEATLQASNERKCAFIQPRLLRV